MFTVCLVDITVSHVSRVSGMDVDQCWWRICVLGVVLEKGLGTEV